MLHNILSRQTASLKTSSRYELLEFLGVPSKAYGSDSTNLAKIHKEYTGALLHHSNTYFPKGFKVVSFYTDAAALLCRAYVLRKEGWRDETDVYQRQVKKKKVASIRNYLHQKKRVFLNNIIVTLPSSTRLRDTTDKPIEAALVTTSRPIMIELPTAFNSIGIIDGQHRVFAYHEGEPFDAEIYELRQKQNLLVTGLIYPPSWTRQQQQNFEAELFLEINSNQTSAGSDLKQAIELMLRPYSSDSMAKALSEKLNTSGSLKARFAKYSYEKDKIKPTSIVSYGLKPIVKLSGNDSLYDLWTRKSKAKLKDKDDLELLDGYLTFCAMQINFFLAGVRTHLGNRWTTERGHPNKVLSTTSINGFIVCLRKVIANKKTGDINYYAKKLKGIEKFDFAKYKSSQYGALGRELYDKFFS